MAAACPPALTLLRVTSAVLSLAELARAGDAEAAARLEAAAALLEGRLSCDCPAPGALPDISVPRRGVFPFA